MRNSKITKIAISAVLMTSLSLTAANAEENSRRRARGPSLVMDLPVTTQGPVWPPSEVANKDGNLVLVGNLLTELSPGINGLVPNQAVIVDKNTVPPLNDEGIEDIDNWFGATHRVVRQLDLSRGSPDLDMVLYSLSMGPGISSSGNPRIPMVGDSNYNLNGDTPVCRDIFPNSLSAQYFRPSFPLHRVPVLGFQGDGVAYNTTTGAPYDPMTASDDPSCAAQGCPGEDAVDSRPTKPITLGDWLKARGRLSIRLTKPNAEGQFTHARFRITMRKMLPNSLYTVWVVRPRQIPIPGVYERRDIDAIALQNVIVTDADGRGVGVFDVPNPFPDPETDSRGLRIIGLSVVYHSDHQTWGNCFARFGPGVEVHAVFNTLNRPGPTPGALPTLSDDFVTVDP